jgi:hypothetical protein
MSDDKKAFTVKDRRHFTTEGDARPEEAEASEFEPPRPVEAPRAVEPAPPEPGAVPGEEDGVDILSFVVSLAAQCGQLLSPSEGGPHLPEARQIISILEMLDEKARDGFTPREKEALAQILYEVRMAFVGVSRKAEP